MAGWSLHYSFVVDESNAVIYEKIHGVWQAKTARSYHDDFMKEVEPLTANPWAKLVDLTNWKTSYPEVIDIIGNHLAWCMSNNLGLSINVLNNPSTFRQLLKMFTTGATRDISHTFRTSVEAEQFLRENWIQPRLDRAQK
ncbi:MAG: hypothetical protein RBT76_04730 [candidate division Zixibacteria bacterium]|jgi:hypothetical protein|nr:hypothetical protein [candidate division Zixibacteria bacterium]